MGELLSSFSEASKGRSTSRMFRGPPPSSLINPLDPMIAPKFEQLPDDAEWWGDPAFRVAEGRPPIQLVAVTDGDPPDSRYAANIVRYLIDVDALILRASVLILDNYSYQHFRELGVAESSLVKEETPEAIAQAVTLQSVWFFDSDCESAELSFSVPWDDQHLFSVEFDSGEATCCSVNG